VLSSLNRHDEAIESERKADDLDLFARPYAMAMFLDESRRWDATIVEARKRLVTVPHNLYLHYFLSDAYSAKGMRKEAEEAFENMLADDGGSTEALAVHRIFEQGGYRGVLQHNLAANLSEAKKHFFSPVSIAQTYAELGDREQALAYLENALNERSGPILWIQSDWRFDFLHSDNRYRAIIKAIGLPPAY
jgi:tetratricopeptide (TPR) repeat protein